MNLQSIIYVKSEDGGPKLSVLDQKRLPNEKVYVELLDVESTWMVIRSMQIRGAPLIAIVACLGLAVDLTTNPITLMGLSNIIDGDSERLLKFVFEKIDYLRTARPTAVNLFNALDELSISIKQKAWNNINDLTNTIVQYAEQLLAQDKRNNMNIGDIGADFLVSIFPPNENLRIMTICNTGSLATAGFGTALGVVRALQIRQKLHSITALETRPYNQGSRLTAFEIIEENMPNGTLICDAAAAAMMKMKGIDACVVGADRICANGDTANKIGTYQLAIVAAAHKVPFFVAAPCSSMDVHLPSGDHIEIEERPEHEMIESSNAPNNIKVWNPAFDVTPAQLIRGIITEKGMIEPDASSGFFDIPGFLNG